MNRKCLCLSIVLLFASSLVQAASETDEKTYQYDTSPGRTIYFDLKSGGEVSIQGWDESTAEVTYMQRGRGHAHTVQIQPQRNGLKITSDVENHEGRRISAIGAPCCRCRNRRRWTGRWYR